MKTQRRRRAPVGEYKTVLAKSRRRDDLIRLHKTPISPPDAIALIATLAERYGVATPAVRFCGYKGRARIEAWAISLPESGNPIERAFSGVGVGSLRIGIVLHEFAHLLVGSGGHGRMFVGVLDALVYAAIPATPRPE